MVQAAPGLVPLLLFAPLRSRIRPQSSHSNPADQRPLTQKQHAECGCRHDGDETQARGHRGCSGRRRWQHGRRSWSFGGRERGHGRRGGCGGGRGRGRSLHVYHNLHAHFAVADDAADEVVLSRRSKRDAILPSHVCLAITLGATPVLVGSHDLHIMLGCHVVEHCRVSHNKVVLCGPGSIIVCVCAGWVVPLVCASNDVVNSHYCMGKCE